MKLKDLSIKIQIGTAFGVILLILALFSVTTRRQNDKMWNQVNDFYNHHLTMRRAIGGIEADIISMNMGMKELFLVNDNQRIQDILQDINLREIDTQKRFNILRQSYVGPSGLINKAYNDFIRWKVIRDNIIDFLRNGQRNEALKAMNRSEGGGSNVAKFMKEVSDISTFFKNNANSDYQRAIQKRKTSATRMLIVVGIFFILLLIIFYWLIEGIRAPLKELTRTTRQFGDGNMEARSHYKSKNELGELSASFNRLATSIQMQVAQKQKENDFITTLFERDDLNAFLQALISELLDFSGSQIAAFYLLNNEKSEFILFESIGLSAKAKTRFSAKLKEGEFGKALSDKKIVHLREIPDDTSFTFTTSGGKFKPKEIITIPIISRKETVAVISLASIYAYKSEVLLLLHNISPSLTARIHGVLLFHQIMEQSKRLEKQNTELEIQEKELSAQSTELSRQNTELKMQKNQLDEANRLKSTFLSNMSHELRTPLNSVIALSSVLKRKLKTSIPEEEYSYIDVIERNGKQLLELINDVLDLSRIESGRVEIEQADVDIKMLINEMIILIDPQAREKKISLKSLIKEDLPTLRSDGNKIRHILQNLIGNAVKFTEKGKVEVTAFEKDKYMHIRVSDTGIGIPSDQIASIFDEFRQVDSSTSRKYGGTGLGLSISIRYAHMLGGTIEVESTPGEGSTFTFVLPMVPVEAKAAENSPIIRRLSASRGKKAVIENKVQAKEKTILVVEDSEPAIIQLKDIMHEAGFQVLVAHNGREALEQIAKTLPDAMILDLMMPDIDGFQVLEAVRANVDTAELPVLVLTAKHLEGKDLKNLRHNHIYQLLQKGDVNREQLLQLVFDMVFPEKKTTGETENKKIIKSRNIKIQSGEKPLILVVEDNVDNLLTIKSLLGENYRIIEAYDGADGTAKARTYRPDLILMDIAMPVMNGFRAFDAIRKEESLQHIPIIAVTASAMTADRDEILHYGFDGYISKPIDIDKLEKTIYHFLKE